MCLFVCVSVCVCLCVCGRVCMYVCLCLSLDLFLSVYVCVRKKKTEKNRIEGRVKAPGSGVRAVALGQGSRRGVRAREEARAPEWQDFLAFITSVSRSSGVIKGPR